MGHDTRLKSHFLKGYMPDIVLVFFANEILSTKVVENHRDGKTVFARQYHSAVLSNFFYHTCFNWLNYHADFYFSLLSFAVQVCFQLFEAARG